MNTTNFFIIGLLIVLILLVLFVLNKINATLTSKLNEVQGNFISHLSTSQGTLGNITEKLTELKGQTQNILEVGKDIQNLQDILKPPKLRGTFGELLLEQILSQILPPQHYKTQHKFQSGDIVDAIVRLKDSQILCIDAKFPLDSLRNYLSQGTKTQEDIPSQFFRDVKKHIDNISGKYILPNEGTLDIAMMYIPAESVYYEIILRDDKTMQYAAEKHVVPVSPLSLYSYLSVILRGLKGMEIEKNAKQVLNQIGNLKIDLDKFVLEFNTLGSHLSNAKTKYDSSRQMISDVSNKFKNMEITS